MSFFAWGANLDVGVKKMNDEHIELIRLMNLLFDRNQAQAPKTELAKIISDLAAYVVKHFTEEEAYMASIQFPDLEKHKIIHKQLLTAYGEQVQKFEKGDGRVSDGFFSFLKLWLNAHIQGIDVKYGHHAKTKKVA